MNCQIHTKHFNIVIQIYSIKNKPNKYFEYDFSKLYTLYINKNCYLLSFINGKCAI